MGKRWTGNRCPWCPKKQFASRELLDKHKKRVHRKLLDSADDERATILRDLAIKRGKARG